MRLINVALPVLTEWAQGTAVTAWGPGVFLVYFWWIF